MKLTVASATQVPQQLRNRSSSREHTAPYKLVVLAPDTKDAVSAAGGLIVDAARAGWHIEVYLEAEPDARALRILGATGRALPPSFDVDQHRPDAVVFAAPMYDLHRGVHRFITDVARQHRADVAAWGGNWATAPVSGSGVEHRLSSAAHAFKHHAMQAVGAAESASPTESFYGALHAVTVAPSPLPG